MSKLEIHVYTGKTDDGGYVSQSVVKAEDENEFVRLHMIGAGAKASAMVVSSHSKSLANESNTQRMLTAQRRKQIGE